MLRRIVVVDNYDSFTYNLVQYLLALGAECDVRLNDRVNVDAIDAAAPDGILLSPGPGNPDDAGVTLQVLRELSPRIPTLGVCLGHQALAQAFGGTIVRADRLMHGKVSPVEHDGRTLFAGLPSPFVATRYHSLIVAPDSLPACLEVSARTAEGEIMGLRHRSLPIEGVQFHPESILSEQGEALLHNWLRGLSR
ncbi:MAG: aminodeoxychorismate/anthranilate synthase component II [Polyangiaceae bacterium]|nr:aminodeoxychorismate/anthranilate synthase component II [Polyangiaceae bacterium]